MSKLEAFWAACPVFALFALVGTAVAAVLRWAQQVDDALDCWTSEDWDPAEFDMAPTMSADYLKPYSHTGEIR